MPSVAFLEMTFNISCCIVAACLLKSRWNRQNSKMKKMCIS